MTAIIFEEAEADLGGAFDYYEVRRPRLGSEFIEEFRNGVALILEHPNAWSKMDRTYRRYRLHRFPYGIVYRVEIAEKQIVIVAVMHLSQRPGWWRRRLKR